MTSQQTVDQKSYFSIVVPRADDFVFWRSQARRLIQNRVHPDQVTWMLPGVSGDLFSTAPSGTGHTALPDNNPEVPVRASKRFLALARNAALHSDPERFALLYSVLWRLQQNIRLMEDKADTDVRRLEELDKSVRRDSHKMHAFVRFREITGDGAQVPDRYVAWFEPDHHIVRANAGFFKRRFANMHWSILTPKGCIHWDGSEITETPPAKRADAPADDATEVLWQRYFTSTFNPARLKVSAMMSEMPKKYWKNMPEAALIPEMIANAQSRELRMVDAGAVTARKPCANLAEVADGITACRDCPIGCMENQAIMGEGRHDVSLMIVGEQPGDQEDQAGRPFVGPAGQLLDVHLAKAGIDRRNAYLTNAVKHFKFVQRGKRRIHQTPTAKEIDTCRWWLEAERRVIKPKLILALGASAARSIVGRTVSVSAVRGAGQQLDDGSELWITNHPSYLLRLDGEAKAEQEALFHQDLLKVASRVHCIENDVSA